MRSDPLYLAFLLLILYGLRFGELGLSWDDINFDASSSRVRQHQVLGPDHPDTLTFRNDFAAA